MRVPGNLFVRHQSLMKMASTHITEKGRETAKGLEGAVLTFPSKLNLKCKGLYAEPFNILVNT